MFKKNLFTILTQLLVILLPFYVILAVFFSVKIWIPKAGFYIKELVLIFLSISLIYEFIKNKLIPKLELIDYLIIAYVIYWIIITFSNWLWFKSIVYWWRYDFIFLYTFLLFKHWSQFLQVSIRNILKTFLISSSISLLFSVLIKFRLWEERLLVFWYIDYVSNWTYNWWIPTYHWLENSWIKRFQWILDWPNQMAFFLILYTSILLTYLKKKFEYHIVLILIIIFWLIILTYSRSALLWIWSWIWLLILFNVKDIYEKYKKQLISWIAIMFIIISTLSILYSDKIQNIFLRTSSTTGHFDRMEIWLNRFISQPMWAWLAEAWPAYRNIHPDKQTKLAEAYYIPESWFIQQLIEWWYIYFSLFLFILINIWMKIYHNSKWLFIWFIAILVMNIFLHIFEATYLSVLLFTFIWLYYNYLTNNKKLV